MPVYVRSNRNLRPSGAHTGHLNFYAKFLAELNHNLIACALQQCQHIRSKQLRTATKREKLREQFGRENRTKKNEGKRRNAVAMRRDDGAQQCKLLDLFSFFVLNVRFECRSWVVCVYGNNKNERIETHARNEMEHNLVGWTWMRGACATEQELENAYRYLGANAFLYNSQQMHFFKKFDWISSAGRFSFRFRRWRQFLQTYL